jgi:hypothetical protein
MRGELVGLEEMSCTKLGKYSTSKNRVQPEEEEEEQEEEEV